MSNYSGAGAGNIFTFLGLPDLTSWVKGVVGGLTQQVQNKLVPSKVNAHLSQIDAASLDAFVYGGKKLGENWQDGYNHIDVFNNRGAVSSFSHALAQVGDDAAVRVVQAQGVGGKAKAVWDNLATHGGLSKAFDWFTNDLPQGGISKPVNFALKTGDDLLAGMLKPAKDFVSTAMKTHLGQAGDDLIGLALKGTKLAKGLGTGVVGRGAALVSPVLYPLIVLGVKTNMPVLGSLSRFAANAMYGDGADFAMKNMSADPRTWIDGVGGAVVSTGTAAGVMSLATAAGGKALLAGAVSLVGLPAAFVPAMAIGAGLLASWGVTTVVNKLWGNTMTATGLRSKESAKYAGLYDRSPNLLDKHKGVLDGLDQLISPEALAAAESNKAPDANSPQK